MLGSSFVERISQRDRLGGGALTAPLKPGPTQPPQDPGAAFQARARAAGTVVTDFIRFIPVAVYFFLYWTPKESIRRALRTGSLGFLSLSLVLLWIEVVGELASSRLTRMLMPAGPRLSLLFLFVFTAAVTGLLRHHARERNHRHSEFLLAERVWEFMLTRNTASWDECIGTALPLFHDVFSRFNVQHLSVALPLENRLKIQPVHVYPAEKDVSYYADLPIDDGVAGLVFKDGMPRYVPRLFFPINGRRRWPLMIFFPHAMVFEIRKGEGRHVDIVRPKLNVDAFKPGDNSTFLYKSFISVPLKPLGYSDCIGVLNVDFGRTDPLDRIHVKLAVFLAVILADELERIRGLATLKA